MKNILVIDNYDSFTYNLVHYLEALNCKVTILRNDETDLEEVKKLRQNPAFSRPRNSFRSRITEILLKNMPPQKAF